MKKYVIIFICLLLCPLSIYAKKAASTSEHYGLGLCNKVGYKCIRMKRGTTWRRMFPDPRERDLAQRLNRSDTYLYRGRKIVIPNDFQTINLKNISPFPLKIKSPNEKLIIVNQNLLALAAYNPNGDLVFWGPLSSGKNYCPDIRRSCRTITGIYYVFNKKGYQCRSNMFPIGRGGSHMPYCMFFYKGYALHGSKEVRGFRDSHGCVRLFTRDAKWLNENFIDVINSSGNKGTKIVVQRLKDN
jgi:L,D-transpeptidase ErfK/SrfK